MNIPGIGQIDFSKIGPQLSELIADPTSNLTATVLVLSMFAILALMLIVMIMLIAFVAPSHHDDDEDEECEDEEDEEEDEEPEVLSEQEIERRAERARKREVLRARVDAVVAVLTRVLYVVLVVTALMSIVYAYGYTGRRQFCAETCHRDAAAVRSADKDAHRSTRCIACHEDGLAQATFERGEHVVAGILRADLGVDPVPADRCLRCHEEGISKVTSNRKLGVRMSHKEPLAAGMSCEDCHAKAGHGTSWPGGMSRCVGCHDGRTAPAECSTCHGGDPTQASRVKHVFPKVHAANRDCGRCHDLSPCDSCHGVRMPHSGDFIAGGHAKVAVFGGKAKCVKCHGQDLKECLKCHDDFKGAHVAGRYMTLEDHKLLFPAAWLAQPTTFCGCHNARPYQNFCALCHDRTGGPLLAPAKESDVATPLVP